MSDQERREVKLRQKEDEAAAAAHEHGDNSRSEHIITENLGNDHDEGAERRCESANGVSAGWPRISEPTRALGGPGIRRRSLASFHFSLYLHRSH